MGPTRIHYLSCTGNAFFQHRWRQKSQLYGVSFRLLVIEYIWHYDLHDNCDNWSRCISLHSSPVLQNWGHPFTSVILITANQFIGFVIHWSTLNFRKSDFYTTWLLAWKMWEGRNFLQLSSSIYLCILFLIWMTIIKYLLYT